MLVEGSHPFVNSCYVKIPSLMIREGRAVEVLEKEIRKSVAMVIVNPSPMPMCALSSSIYVKYCTGHAC